MCSLSKKKKQAGWEDWLFCGLVESGDNRRILSKTHFEIHFQPSLCHSDFCLLLAKYCWRVGAPTLTQLTSVTVSRRTCDSQHGSTTTQHNYSLISLSCFCCQPSLRFVKTESFSTPATAREDALAEVMWPTQLILRRWLVKGWHENGEGGRGLWCLQKSSEISLSGGLIQVRTQKSEKLQWISIQLLSLPRRLCDITRITRKVRKGLSEILIMGQGTYD